MADKPCRRKCRVIWSCTLWALFFLPWGCNAMARLNASAHSISFLSVHWSRDETVTIINFFFLFTKLTTGSYLRKRDVESPKSAYFDGPSIFSASSNSNHLGGKNCAVNCFLHVISIFFPHEKSLNNDQDKPIELLSCTDASELPPGNSLLFNHIN